MHIERTIISCILMRKRERERGREGRKEGGRLSENEANRNSLWELLIEEKIRILLFDL